MGGIINCGVIRVWDFSFGLSLHKTENGFDSNVGGCCKHNIFSRAVFSIGLRVVDILKNEIILKNKLKAARAEKELSQAGLAEMVGVSRNTISSIETGQFCPTAKLALILCIALDKKFEDLFYFE